MSQPTYTKAEPIRMKNHPSLTEKWLQDLIARDPSILGLGEIELIDRERIQHKAGRLDLLLSDPDNNIRYEVELMLGSTDESHIIRTIEYWDIERRRYPGYDHVAVIVAEDITSRFLNVLSLFSGSIPFIALHMSAIQIQDSVSIVFSKVIDSTDLRTDDASEANLTPTDRNYWIAKSTSANVAISDSCLDIVNAISSDTYELKYNKYYIGLSDGYRPRNFIYFKPQKRKTSVIVKSTKYSDWAERLEEDGIDSSANRRGFRLNLVHGQTETHKELLAEIFSAAIENYSS